MNLDESIGKIEVDPKEEASVVEVFQDVLDKLSDVGKKDKLLKFFKLVQDGLTKLANLLMQSQCALSEPISSSRKTRTLTVCRFI
jgi:hypothetical protein